MSTEYVQLTEQLAQLKAQEEAIQAQLAAERETVRTGLIESLKQHIGKYGFSVEEIASAMLPKARGKRGSGKAGTKVSKPATVFRDNETGQTYSKGRVPEWLRAQMLKVQLDPNDKESLKEYKVAYMTALEPEVTPEVPAAPLQEAA